MLAEALLAGFSTYSAQPNLWLVQDRRHELWLAACAAFFQVEPTVLYICAFTHNLNYLLHDPEHVLLAQPGCMDQSVLLPNGHTLTVQARLQTACSQPLHYYATQGIKGPVLPISKSQIVEAECRDSRSAAGGVRCLDITGE